MIICIAIVVITTIIAAKSLYADCFMDWAFSVLAGILYAIIPFIIALCLFGNDYDRCVVEKKSSQEIISLKDNMNIRGSAYLFGGHIDEDLYYFYAKETEQGYITDKVKASRCYINYTNETPRIESYEATGFKTWTTWIYAIPAYHHYSIYVPDGTIVTDYEINLE